MLFSTKLVILQSYKIEVLKEQVDKKGFIQNLCATTPGQTSTLLQPEAVLFPIHFNA